MSNYNFNQNKVEIVLNEVDLLRYAGNEVVIKPEGILIHPDYVPGALPSDNDIALIRVSSLTQHQGCFWPVCLPKTEDEGGQWCHVAGWGQTEKAAFSRKLMQVGIHILACG